MVANRVRNSKAMYEPLERFLDSLKLPFLTQLSDSENYILATARGMGIFEMDHEATIMERGEFLPILSWLGSGVEQECNNSTGVIQLSSTNGRAVV